MTGNALNLALKLVVLHVELENVKHGVFCDALLEVSETLFHWIGLKKLAGKHVNYNIVSALYPEIPPPPKPILDKNSPTGIGLICCPVY